ncbi:hypothetical protein NLG97_g5646 [Lecanicillium saksenae]|uniref:Uncharacterized protein n=1 Tax=Lecanicillium saksenae TaxID=468837 RepID=A0ACC1QRV9_9HYPO|nr:hypothetical protein NLG97_g5646 [Lecanicillium saksenae]
MAGQYGYGNQQNPYDQRGQGNQQPNPYDQRGQGYGGGPQRGYGGQQQGGYGGQQQGGYGGQQQGGYGGQPRPQQQRPPQQRPQQQQNPYGGGQGGYGRPQQQQNPYAADGGNSRYANTNNSSMDGGYAGSNVEMAPLTQNAGSMAGSSGNGILDECAEIDRGIRQIGSNLEQLKQLQKRTLDDADSSSNSAAKVQLDTLSEATMTLYRNLTGKVRTLKSNPEANTSRNKAQVGRIDRSLKQAIQEFQKIESEFRKNTKEQFARQYRIVRPEANDAEIQAAVEDPNAGQVFAQAVMKSDRQGRAQAALSAVKERQAALAKIEAQMVELSQLFQDMDTLVVQQEAAVIQIEQKGEEVVENLDKGNEEMGVAVNTARKTRRKKWICLGICVAILVVIVIIVLVYIFVIRGTGGGNNNNNNGGKRSIEIAARALLPDINARAAEAQEGFSELGRLMKDRVHMPQIAPQ